MLRTLYLIRHAHPKQNTGIAYDRPPGPPLDEQGEDEARAAGHFVATLGIQQLYVSPLARAQQTSQLIAGIAQTPLSTEAGLAEHRSDETFEDVKTRMRAVFAQADAAKHTVAGFVAHGSPIKAMIQILSNEQFNLTPFQYAGGNNTPTAGIWRAHWTLSAWQFELVFEPKLATL